MNKYKFLGAILHIVYRILSFMTRKEYFYADGGGPEEGPGVQIGDKGSDHPHPGGANPHDSRVLVHAA